MRKILVVDDNLDYLELLASVLGKYFEVHEATGVKDALRVLSDKEKEIEAICSDYNMRDGTGLDLLEKVRQKGITIPFLLMSGDGDHVLKQKARLYGGVFCSKTDCDFIERIKALVKSET
jgi:sigma-54 dependent response regulator